MSDDREVGLTVTAKDAATKAIKGIGVSAKTSLGAVRKMGSAGGAALKGLGVAAAVANQALELAKKGWELFRMAIVDTISEALRFRREGDASRKFFEDFKRNAETMRARIGDVLIPVVQGFGEVIDGLVTKFKKWVIANRQVIGSGIIEWVAKLSTLLVKGVVRSVLMITKVWQGWMLIIETGKAAINAFFSVVLSGVSKAMGAMGKLAEAVGADGVAGRYKIAAEAASGFGAEFSKSSDEATDSAFEIAASIEKVERDLMALEKTAVDAIGKGATRAFELLKQGVVGTNTTIEESKKRTEELNAAIDALIATRALKIDMDTERINNDLAALSDNADEEAAKIEAALTRAFATVSLAAETAFAAMLDGSKSVGEAFVDMAKQIFKVIIQQVLAVIVARAIEGAATAVSAHAAIPFVGLAIGAAAGSAFLGAILSYKGKVPKNFAAGGLVVGGIPGRDSVPAMLAPGERVQSVGAVRREARQSRNMRGSTTINASVSVQTLDASSVNEATKQDLAATFGELIAQAQERGAVGGI